VPRRENGKDANEAMIGKIDNLILDMDGVLWRGETAIPGLAEFFETLRDLEMGYILATNNATKTASEYVQKLARMGVTVGSDSILTSAETTATYLASVYPPGTTVYVVGTESLQAALKAKGFSILQADQAAAGSTAELVVLGFAPNVVYWELAMGALLVEKGAQFIGTNPDVSYPHELGPLPGAGSLLAVISTATGVEPTIIGKPGPLIFEEAIRRLSGNKEDTAMVGDRLGTDIAGANAAGLTSIMLLTGISSRDDIRESGIEPDFVFADISELAQELKMHKVAR
jgi:4-nitrophenyl phosphatase